MGIFLAFGLHALLAGALLVTSSSLPGLQRLTLGESISVGRPGDVLVSAGGTFSAGFVPVGENAYGFSIWYTHALQKTVVWMANRDKPANGKHSKLWLHNDGSLVLLSGGEGKVWEAGAGLGWDVISLELLETGNLVLTSRTGNVVWESFASATDTLLPGQTLTRNTMLLSKRAAGDYCSGFYNFKFNDDNVLYLIYNGPEISSVYWPPQDTAIYTNGRTNFNSSRVATLDDKGFFLSSDHLNFSSSDYGPGPSRRLTLDHDGLLRLYSLNETTGDWAAVWLPDIKVCEVHGLCGAYGICTYLPEPMCTCPPGFHRADPEDWSRGCRPEFNLTCATGSVNFIRFRHTDYYGNDLEYRNNATLNSCRRACWDDPRCQGFGIRGKNCYPKYALLNGQRTPSNTNRMYIKVPASTGVRKEDGGALIHSGLQCSDRSLPISRSPYLKYLVGFVGALGALEAIMIILGWRFVRRAHRSLGPAEMGYRCQLVVGFRRFTYAELKAMTRNFSKEIGNGGFGSVYRGVLEDGRTAVAVKRLEGVTQGEAEFWAEVAVIGRINHINLVRVWGFCAEGKNRLLIYEYLENGSLDKLLFASDAAKVLNWEKRYAIAVGTAMGLAYLHEECLEWVLHCDVKPQNILLDEQHRPKLADFGMSKLTERGTAAGGSSRRVKCEVSRVRGTRGYMAPEWMVNQEITAKADVYSFGVVLLELITGKSATGVSEGQWNHLIRWVEEKMEGRHGMDQMVDEGLNGGYDEVQAELVLRVALLCVRTNKNERPAMSTVVGLLLGDLSQDDDWSSQGSPA
ncbi:unnamed protein product [Spirodela intermedia]|uniref:Receptor-like serine/threonine-protein kinase n=1 Tax=Spirodela intermedia TaxID=51605 RepID=A0A7I8KUA9_SPIIN|nr:unnamed protein product [Spirodela intermedia]